MAVRHSKRNGLVAESGSHRWCFLVLLISAPTHTFAATVTAVGTNGTIIGSDDGGQTWTPQPTPTNQELNAVDFIDVNDGWAVGHFDSTDDATILHTSNGGNSWQRIPSQRRFIAHAATFIDANQGWIAGSLATILHTSDGRSNWTDQVTGENDDS